MASLGPTAAVVLLVLSAGCYPIVTAIQCYVCGSTQSGPCAANPFVTTAPGIQDVTCALDVTTCETRETTGQEDATIVQTSRGCSDPGNRVGCGSITSSGWPRQQIKWCHCDVALCNRASLSELQSGTTTPPQTVTDATTESLNATSTDSGSENNAAATLSSCVIIILACLLPIALAKTLLEPTSWSSPA
ncbi:hypothetical protein BV898_08917 [Hypsibius exemplaris]|uniref:Protein sleepless n=1 Tax=Hypsibius exemplaris TaxID=2072580 RepID=A0A1W0WNW9_HYPEX|nr:hypothetical protein BV898_08917 [Hypsibius exemplaris]